MRVFVRYYQEDEKGETRAERNERAERDTPELIIPEVGERLYDLFFEMSRSINRVRDGICQKLIPSEVKAFIDLSGERLTPTDYEILRAMDVQFCQELQLEINANAQRYREQAQQRK